jgi:activator of HSP90 ATPase
MEIKTQTIRWVLTFKADSDQVYEALMDSKKHSVITGSNAKISRKVGGEFSVYDGEIQGKNVELVPGQRIVQTWPYSDWPAGHYSRCTFSLKVVPDGTRLTFTQSGVPEDAYADIRQGWNDYYWEPMKAMFAGKAAS